MARKREENMFKLLRKLVLGPETVDERCAKIVKNKNMSVEEKCEKIISEYKEYFKNQIKNDAVTATYETHYEKFDNNGRRNEKIYRHLYEEELKDIIFTKKMFFRDFFSKLKTQGLKEEDVSEENINFIKKMTDLTLPQMPIIDNGREA